MKKHLSGRGWLVTLVVPLAVACGGSANSESNSDQGDAGNADAIVNVDAVVPGADTGVPGADTGGKGDTGTAGDTTPATDDAAKPATVEDISAGFLHTCIRLSTGAVRCWGGASYGQLGYANTTPIGDVKTPAAVGAGDVNVGGSVTAIALGNDHTCTIVGKGTVRCWGRGEHGRLGYGNLLNVGDKAHPATAGDVNVGGMVSQISASWSHTCARMVTGAVRCWGLGRYGKLGKGTTDIGDVKPPAAYEEVNVGGSVLQVVTGDEHTCALLVGGKVRCWGWGSAGRLGYGNENDIGDDETPASVGDVQLGEGEVIQLAAGYAHTCALIKGGTVRCWGASGSGQLGYGNAANIGDNELPSKAGDVKVGGPVKQIVAGYVHTCALLETGTVRCWGQGNTGQLGYGNTFNVGDDKTPSEIGDVNIGGNVKKIAAGYAHNCAIMTTGAVRCWGYNGGGQLGYGNTNNVGDKTLPFSAGDVPLF